MREMENRVSELTQINESQFMDSLQSWVINNLWGLKNAALGGAVTQQEIEVLWGYKKMVKCPNCHNNDWEIALECGHTYCKDCV